MKFTLEEQSFLKHMDVDTLRLFVDIKDHKLWQKMVDFFVKFNDIVKEAFFDENEMKYNEEDLKARHAYSRGQINATRTMIRLMAGARQELTRREEANKNKREELKQQ